MIQEITVNQLNQVLRKAFRVKRTSIESAIINLPFKNRAQKVTIGVSGQLTIQFQTSRKIKGLPVIDL